MKISLQDRLEAIDFLAEGKTIDQIVELLKEKHREYSPEIIRATYFPNRGWYCLNKLEGAPKEIIEKRKCKIETIVAEQSERSRRVMLKLNQNPVFVAALKERSSQHMKRLHQNPVFAASIRERLRNLHHDPQFATVNRERSSNILKRLWQDPLFVAANSKRASDTLKRLHRNPIFAAAHRERLQILNSNPIFAATHRERSSDILKQLWHDPLFRAKVCERSRRIMLELHRDPVFAAAHSERSRQKMIKLHNDPDFAAAHKMRMVMLWKDPNFIEKRRDGIGRYWNTYRLKIREMLENWGIDIQEQTRNRRSNIIISKSFNPELAVLLLEKVDIVRQALAELSDLERQVILASFFEDEPEILTPHEIANTLGISEAKTASILGEALKKLAGNRILREVY